jgi:hypothetical protein
MAAVLAVSDKQDLTYTPTAGTAVDLACYVTEPPEDAVDFNTIDTPTLCNPQGSKIQVGARTITLTLAWTDDWNTKIEPLFGTSGTLLWHPVGGRVGGYTYNVTWPSTYGITAPFGEVISVPVTLGVTSRTWVATAFAEATAEEPAAPAA